ncbi:hypothetical protein [uncultured Rubinisphaera sp.]|uniref:hypothetical protein n=1 Tax=uncultured Rubinisphaera sp. TaxID=1678686 RepID=UPI0030DDD69B|tara:strand:- start:909 stop:1163 length:255 start_codon:yes stop_codon:yes gene_type:complete
METDQKIPDLTPEQIQALDSSVGIVKGEDYILMKKSFFQNWCGLDDENLSNKLKIGFDQASRKEFIDWNPEEIKKGENRQDAKF